MSLYDYVMYVLKIEQLNKGIISLTWIDILLFIMLIILDVVLINLSFLLENMCAVLTNDDKIFFDNLEIHDGPACDSQ